MHFYVAGPMRGMPKYNFPAFEEAEQWLLARGYDVTSPHRLDLQNGFDPEKDEPFFIEDCARRDIDAIFSVDALVLLPGWENSKGAKAEKALADWIERPCYTYPEMEVIPPS